MQKKCDQDETAVNSSTGWSRREMLQAAGVALATAALPRPLAAATRPAPAAPGAAGVSPVMAQLSAYMGEAGSRALPEPVVEIAKQHLLDTLAAMISGSTLLPGRKAIAFVKAYGGERVSSVAASNIVCGPIEAALANGMLAHSDETDDSHSPSQCHPGCAIIPATLAAGERFGVDGTRFLRALVLGYDVGTRVTMTLGGQQFEVDSHWSTHSIAPLFGAAAAAGCTAGLDAGQMQLLLGYAAQQSSGLGAWRRDPQHVQKAFVYAGMTARSGVTAALLVQAGWTGVEDIFSGADNFFAAYDPHADPAGLVDQLGVRYEVTRTNIKKWCVGSPIQAVLDGLEQLRKQHPFTAEEVRQVTVQLATDEAAIVNNRELPDICLQQMVAVMLMDHTVTFSSANDLGRMKDPATLRQRAKVQLIPSAALEKLMPLRVGIVSVKLANGTVLTQRVDKVRGTPQNPMTHEEVAAKADSLIAPVLGSATATALIDKVFHLEQVRDIRELRPLIQTA